MLKSELQIIVSLSDVIDADWVKLIEWSWLIDADWVMPIEWCDWVMRLSDEFQHFFPFYIITWISVMRLARRTSSSPAYQWILQTAFIIFDKKIEASHQFSSMVVLVTTKLGRGNTESCLLKYSIWILFALFCRNWTMK